MWVHVLGGKRIVSGILAGVGCLWGVWARTSRPGQWAGDTPPSRAARVVCVGQVKGFPVAAALYSFEYHVTAVVVLEVVGEVHGVGGVGKGPAEELGHVEGPVGGGGLHTHIEVAIVDEGLGVVLNALALPGSGADEFVAVRWGVAVIVDVMIR